MKLMSLKKIAAVSAVALGVAMAGYNAYAAPVDTGVATTVGLGATVANGLDVTATTLLNFGTIGAIMDPTDTATMTIEPDGTFDDSPGTGAGGPDPASIVSDPANPGNAGVMTVTAFTDVDLWVTYSDLVDLTDGTDSFTFVEIHDDLATNAGAGAGTCTIGACVNGSFNKVTNTTTIGVGHTNAGTGIMTYNLGATIETKTGTYGPYNSAVYAGSFDVIYSY